MRSEYSANLALQAPRPQWQEPSRCQRPQRKGLVARIWAWFN